MLTLHTRLEANYAGPVDGEVVLPFGSREKSRLRVQLSNGEAAGIFTVRGTVLRDGDLLRGDDGRVVRVRAAVEDLYRVECDNDLTLLRCAFHLGNRHTQAAFAESGTTRFLRIQRDTVLKDMLQGLGATVTEEVAPFDPESGAYAGGGHHHHGDHPLAPIPLRQKIHRPSDPA